MQPRPEIAHWLFASLFLLIGLAVIAEAIVGTDVFRRRPWRGYLWPSLALFGGVMLWVVAVLSTFSTLHLLAHVAWAQAAMIAGAVQLAVVRGKLHSPAWSLATAAAMLLTGVSFLIHEQNGWLFARSAFLHHSLGWLFVIATIVPVLQVWRPRLPALRFAFGLTFVAVAVLLYADRDIAPIFGHLSDQAGIR